MKSFFLIVSAKTQVKSGIEQLARQCCTASETMHNQRDAQVLCLFDLEQKVESSDAMQDDRSCMAFGQSQMAEQHLGLQVEMAPA